MTAPFIDKTFEYCYVRWDIYNFSLINCKADCEIFSSCFRVNAPETTLWRLILNSLWTDDGKNFLSVLLERLDSDNGPEKVWVNWKVSQLYYNESPVFSVEQEHSFARNEKHELELVGFPHVMLVCTEPSDKSNDALTLELEMIVDHIYNARKLDDVNVDFGQQLLSEDMRRFFNRNTSYDIKIKINNAYFKAHLPILASRNSLIRRVVTPGKNLEFKDLDVEAFERILRYLYTANLKYIFINPTISLMECIKFFEMEELQEYFSKRVYDMHSIISSMEYEFLWPVPDLKIEESDYECSDYFQERGTDEVWRIHLFSNGINYDCSAMDVILEYIEGPKRLNATIKFSLQNHKFKRIQEKEISSTLAVGSQVDTSLVHRNALPEKLRNGELNIIVKIEIIFLDEVSCTIDDHRYHDCPRIINPGLYYSGLALNMRQLLVTGEYTDITLNVSGKHFQAHKCILAARSKTLSNMISTSDEDILLDIEARLFSKLLNYMYTGELRLQGVNALKQIYNAAVIFEIRSLKLHCSQYLKQLISFPTVVDILLIAEDNEDEVLKYAAMDFIWKSFDRIDEVIDWEDFTEKTPKLFADIVQYFQSQRTDAVSDGRM